ncbi:MAG: amino acid permease [Gemmataceae bacterium]|nr:amino acid permease [Gemmataceae bacterium]
MARVLGLWVASAVVIGTTIGSGVFKKAFAITQDTPYFGIILLLWIGGGVLTFFGALAYAEIVSLLPKAGGNYTFLKEAYGPLWGFLWGWTDFVIIRAASLAALAGIFVDSFCDLARWPLPLLGKVLLTIGVILGLSWVNIRGTRLGGGLQVFITVVKVLSLSLIALTPLYFLAGFGPRETINPQNLQPWWPQENSLGASAIFSAFLAILWAYQGWGNIAPVAEEIRDPQRNIPLALITGVGIITLLYVTANVAYHLVLPMEEIRNMSPGATVATEALRKAFGNFGAMFASLAIMISVVGALNGNILAGPRLLYAMGQDRMAPVKMQELHPRYGTPALAILTLACWASILTALGAVVAHLGYTLSLFDLLTNFVIFGSMIFESMAVLSIYLFRRTMASAPRPYRCWGYPFTPVLFTVMPVCVLANMFLAKAKNAAGEIIYPHHPEVLAGVLFLVLGAGVYFIFLRGRLATGEVPPSFPGNPGK